MPESMQSFNFGVITGVINQLDKGVEPPDNKWAHRYDTLPGVVNKGNHAVLAFNDDDDTFMTINNEGIVSISNGGLAWRDVPTGKPGLYHALLTDGDTVVALRAWAGNINANPEAPQKDFVSTAGQLYIGEHYVIENYNRKQSGITDPAFVRAAGVVGGVTFKGIRDAIVYLRTDPKGLNSIFVIDSADAHSKVEVIMPSDYIKYIFTPAGEFIEGPIGEWYVEVSGIYLRVYARTSSGASYIGYVSLNSIPSEYPRRATLVSSGWHQQTFEENDDGSWSEISPITLAPAGVTPKIVLLGKMLDGVGSVSAPNWGIIDGLYVNKGYSTMDEEAVEWNLWDGAQAVGVQRIQLTYPIGLVLSKTGKLISEIIAPFIHGDLVTACAYGNGIWAAISPYSPRTYCFYGYSVIVSRGGPYAWEAIHIPEIGPYEDPFSIKESINNRSSSLVFDSTRQKFLLFMSSVVVETGDFDEIVILSSNLPSTLGVDNFRVYYGGGKYFAWGMSYNHAGTGNGSFAKSDDGLSWVPVVELTQSGILPEAVGYQNGEWLVIGELSNAYSSGYAISRDGMETWEINDVAAPLPSDFQPTRPDLKGWWRGVAKGKGRWVAVKGNTRGNVTSIATYK